MASRVAMSRASSRAWSTPNCSTMSTGACMPASLMTSAGSSMVAKLAPFDSLLISRVMRMSTMRSRTDVGSWPMNCWPARIAATLSSPNTCGRPGSPRPAPVTTTGSSGVPAAGGTCAAVVGAGATDSADGVAVAGAPPYRRSPCSSTPANSRPSSWMVSSDAMVGSGVTGTTAAAARLSVVGVGVGVGTATAAPRPAAYSPHSAWLNAAASPSLGWLV